MKKLHSLLLTGMLAFSALAGAIFTSGNREVHETRAVEKATHSITTKYIYDNSESSEEGWGFDIKKDGLLCNLNMYKRSVSSQSSLSTMGFQIHVNRANNYIPDAQFRKITKFKVSFKVTDLSESQTSFSYYFFKTDYAEENKLYSQENLPKSSTTVYGTTLNVDGSDTSIDEYIFEIEASAHGRFLTTDLTFEVWSTVEAYPVTISAGTGVSSVFLSNNISATSGSTSGSEFEKGTTVYGFATLKPGYKPNTGWTNINDNIYRIGEIENLSTSSAFGTISTGETINYLIGYELNGGTVSGTNPEEYNVETDTFTLINPTKTGYTFTGWSGTGISGTSTSVTITKGSTGGREYTANWTEAQYNITYLDGESATAYSGSNFDALPKTHTYNSTTELVEGTKPGNIFDGWYDNSDCTGEPITSIGPTDRTSDFALYAKWIVKDAVLDTINKINAIGEVSYPGSGDAINLARTAYEALDAGDKGGVTNYSTLQDAEIEYENQKNAGVTNVENLINAIGVVEDTPACKNKIDAARTAYDALTTEQKGLVTPSLVQAFKDAEAEYKAIHDQNMADSVKGLINAIGEVEYTSACKGKIDAARQAYNGLTTDQKALISDEEYKVLTDAEKEYADLQAINTVKDLINAIGKVEYTNTCKARIVAARNAYNSLTASQKAAITVEEYKVLTDAETAYKTLDDAAKADIVKDLINNIGEVSYTETCKSKIDLARNGYTLLTLDQKALISDEEYKVLTGAETAYAALKADHDAADAVKSLIDAIGKVEFTQASKAKIDAANNAYNALTVNQKDLVTNKKVLFDAIELYNTLAHQPEVNENGVDVKGKDGDLIPVNVNVKVEVKTTVEAQEGTTAYENIKKAVGGDQKIAGVYDIKLMRTEGDQVTVIQPSDIKQGMVIVIEITLPDGLSVEGLRVLHIHDENDISYIEDFKIDAGKLTFETDRLSEIAFVVPNPSTGLPAWAIVLIVIGGLLVLCCLCLVVMFIFFPRYIIDYSKKKVIRTIYLKNEDGLILLLDTSLRKVRRSEEDVYRSKEEAEKAL